MLIAAALLAFNAFAATPPAGKLAPAEVPAQSSSSSRRAAEKWLALLDDAKFEEAWKAPPKDTNPARVKFLETMTRTRKPLGKPKTRGTLFEEIRGVSASNSRHVTALRYQTLTDFESGTRDLVYEETIDVEEGQDGVWSITSYSIEAVARSRGEMMTRAAEIWLKAIDGLSEGIGALGSGKMNITFTMSGRRNKVATKFGSFTLDLSEDRTKVVLLVNDKLDDELIPGEGSTGLVGKKGPIPDLTAYVREKVRAALAAPGAVAAPAAVAAPVAATTTTTAPTATPAAVPVPPGISRRAAFDKLAAEVKLAVELPKGFSEVSVLTDVGVAYDVAFRDKGGDVEVRYHVVPIPPGSSPEVNSRHVAFTDKLIASVLGTAKPGADDPAEKLVEDQEADKSFFGASWARVVDVNRMESAFGKGFQDCRIVALHKENVADVYVLGLAKAHDDVERIRSTARLLIDATMAATFK